MKIVFKTGDLFAEPVDAIVNTVNCVGVMGKGIALQFKNKYKENFKQYKSACDNKELDVGQMLVYHLQGDLLAQNKFIINFPTKKHWRSKSKIEYIEDGLDALVNVLEYTPEISSIAIPALGCGNGELEWNTVKALIKEKFENVEHIQVIVFEPYIKKRQPERVGVDLNMTTNMAFVLKAFSELEVFFGGAITHLSAQKIVYFLQEFYNHPFGVTFEPNKYGPYSEDLKKKLAKSNDMKYITGFVGKDKTISVSQHIYAHADEFLKENSMTKKSDEEIAQLALLIEGFESPLGMELLATVHYCYKLKSSFNSDDIKQCIHQWSDRKSEAFTDRMIRDAVERLKEDMAPVPA